MKYARCQEHQKGFTMNNNKSVRFTINFVEKTITGTKASFTKASKGTGEAYEELAAKIAHHPDFKLVIKEPKKRTTKAKRTYNGLNFPFMEAYISIQRNAAQIMREYKAVKKMAEESGISIYPFTKKWFLGEFDPDGLGFDMENAKQEIANYRIAKAVFTVAPASAEENDDQANDLLLVG